MIPSAFPVAHILSHIGVVGLAGVVDSEVRELSLGDEPRHKVTKRAARFLLVQKNQLIVCATTILPRSIHVAFGIDEHKIWVNLATGNIFKLLSNFVNFKSMHVTIGICMQYHCHLGDRSGN